MRAFNCLSRASVSLLVLLLFASSAWAASGRPNVILIMTDDQGSGDFGFAGNNLIRTPNLDAMAARGARMSRFYVSPVCAPTRASLMTGRYNYRTRAIDTFVGRAMMDPQEVTLAEILRNAGYATGIFGKWHLGDCYPMRPQDQGFDEVLVHRGGGIGQPGDPPGGEGKYTDPVLQHNGRQVAMKGYCTDVYFDAALDWMERIHRESDRPFFVYLPTNAPHGPFHDVPEDLLAHYKTVDLSALLSQDLKGERREQELDTLARIFAMIENVDANVGKLFASLDRLDLTDDTIVMFLTDNGPNTMRYVGDLRGMKGGVHEGGIRTPLLVHAPGRVTRGHRVPVPAAHYDILPTVLDACGVDPPAGVRLDGVSVWPLLQGREVVWPDRTLFIQAHRGDVPVKYHHFAAIGPRFKLLCASGFGKETLEGDPSFELYDISSDPGERENLADKHTEVLKQMKAEYEAWFDDVGSTRPDNYAPPRIIIGTPHENPTVLTRQDWRHEKGQTWAPDSVGVWKLEIAEKGIHDILLRFPKTEVTAIAALQLGESTITQQVDPGRETCTFERLTLEPGPTDLRATITQVDRTAGVSQVEMHKK